MRVCSYDLRLRPSRMLAVLSPRLHGGQNQWFDRCYLRRRIGHRRRKRAAPKTALLGGCLTVLSRENPAARLAEKTFGGTVAFGSPNVFYSDAPVRSAS